MRPSNARRDGFLAVGLRILPWMRLLFFTWPSILRRYSDVVTELTHDGHDVVIACPAQKHGKLPKELRGLPGVRIVAYDEVSDPMSGRAIELLRNTRDYIWYMSPEQRIASFNRRQALDRLVQGVTAGDRRADPAWPDPIVALGSDERASLDGALVELELRIPPDGGIVDFIRTHRPDAVLVSPLVKQQFHQAEVVKAARSLGIPTGFLVYSWDNLSNKGRIHVPPDRTFVWNELQRREAVELHGLDPRSIAVTGAPHWDAFFGMAPSVGRDEFCRSHGFEAGFPIVLYLGSTGRICPDEPRVVEGWLNAVRNAPGLLRETNILIRRHPDEARQWLEWRAGHERVSLSRHPRRQDQTLYDELHHAAAAVGLNTSAQIEASILAKPVLTFAAGELAPGQQGTLHFYYLLKEHGGVVTFAETLGDHVAQLGRAVAGDYDRDAIRRFCETFVRPRGVDRPVAPILVEHVIDLVASGGRKKRPLGWLRANDRTRPGTTLEAAQ